MIKLCSIKAKLFPCNKINQIFLWKQHLFRSMGFLLVQGRPLTFEENKKFIKYIKEHGVSQFLNLYNAHKNRQIPLSNLKWGDETEFHLIYFDAANKSAKLMINANEFRESFNLLHKDKPFIFQQEYGGWMVEATPKKPYKNLGSEYLSNIDIALHKRRAILKDFFFSHGISINSLPVFPNMGIGDYISSIDDNFENAQRSENLYSQSLFSLDKAIHPHPRFRTLTQNIRKRRGEKVSIRIPLYLDQNTDLTPSEIEPFPSQIYMDSMQFGMGANCLQLTFEAQNINHARFLHDQLHVLSPIMAALSATSPVFKGKLADIDLRWTVISQCVDDRTPSERDKESPDYKVKSRYGTMNHFISDHEYVDDEYFDGEKQNIDPEIYQRLRRNGLDDRLAFHIATLFVRDPLVLFKKGIYLDDDETTSHFENFQSTNWNSVRFKPPPSMDSKIGWRVEFRTLDIQITDFENAALSAVVGLLVNIINEFDLNFLMPISKCDENMERAHNRDAVLKEKFWFRSNILGSENYETNTLQETDFTSSNKLGSEKADLHLLSIEEILEGKPSINYKGILPLIEEYMDLKCYKEEHKHKIREYLNFVRGRGNGMFKTGARYIRDIVENHSSYKQDSIVPEDICFQILATTSKLGNELQDYLDVCTEYAAQQNLYMDKVYFPFTEGFLHHSSSIQLQTLACLE